MTLSEYFNSPGSLTVSQLRELVGAKSDAQVRQWQHGYAGRSPSPQYCVAIEKATKKAVTRQDLRPTDWQQIWPELRRKRQAAIVAADATRSQLQEA